MGCFFFHGSHLPIKPSYSTRITNIYATLTISYWFQSIFLDINHYFAIDSKTFVQQTKHEVYEQLIRKPNTRNMQLDQVPSKLNQNS
jgi:hypothetical protein